MLVVEVEELLVILLYLLVELEEGALEVELEDCYANGVSEYKIAEALSLVLWPCGVNRFLEASGAWLKVLRSGKVTPSAPFQAWADTPGQDGFQLAPRSPAAS